MTSATMRLIEAVERLNMTGEIGDGMVATLHDLAAMARLEQRAPLPLADEPLPVPSVDDLVTLSPDALEAIRMRERYRQTHPGIASRWTPGPVIAQPDYARLGIGDPEGQN